MEISETLILQPVVTRCGHDYNLEHYRVISGFESEAYRVASSYVLRDDYRNLFAAMEERRNDGEATFDRNFEVILDFVECCEDLSTHGYSFAVAEAFYIEISMLSMIFKKIGRSGHNSRELAEAARFLSHPDW